MNRAKRWCTGILAATMALLVCAALLSAWLDPFFHYRAPRAGMAYRIDSSIYMNDGMIRHFDYDTVIIGSSETFNFRASECDALFDCHTLKTPHAEAKLREIYDDLSLAFACKGGLKNVFFGLDCDRLLLDKDAAVAEVVTPDYLRDGNPFNDLRYLLNKDVLLKYTLPTLIDTARGKGEPVWDDYQIWSTAESFDPAKTYRVYDPQPIPEQQGLTAEERLRVRENAEQNIVSLAKAHPETTFYVFSTPYSIGKLYGLAQADQLGKMFEAEKLAAELLLDCPNVRYFSFLADTETICDLNNYIDPVHYGPWINSKMLRCMRSGEYELTRESLPVYYREITELYLSYDYEHMNG